MKSETTALMVRPKDEIVVYQPNETTRLEVRVEQKTVWLTQAQLCQLFGRERSVITKHIRNVFAEGEVDEKSNVHFLHIPNSDKPVSFYSLNVIISVGYRVKSQVGTQFRIWANNVLEKHVLGLSAYEPRMTKLENRKDALELELKRAEPLPEQLFCEGQFFDAYNFFCDLIRKAKRRVYLIDNYVNDSVLTMFDKRGKNVAARIYTGKFPKQLQLDLARHNAQYPPIEIVNYPSVHDRFLIIDDIVWLVGASMKDAGKKKFAVLKTQFTPEAILPLTHLK